MTRVSIALDRTTVTGRTALEKKIVHILDAQSDPEFNFTEALKRVNFRTLLGVPLLREGMPIGVIVLMRKTVQPFTDKQIELVNTFADQAVIAIENVRLFDEVQTLLAIWRSPWKNCALRKIVSCRHRNLPCLVS